MKKILIYFTLLGLTLSSYAFKLSGKYTGVGTKTLTLYDFYGNFADPIKTIDVVNNAFTTDLNITPGVYWLGVSDKNLDQIVLDGSDISIKVENLKELKITAENSSANQEYKQYLQQYQYFDQELNRVNNASVALQKKYQEDIKDNVVDQSYYENEQKKISNSVGELFTKHELFFGQLNKTAKSSFTKVYAESFSRMNAAKESFFSENDFQESLANGDFISRKVTYYFLKHVSDRSKNGLINEINTILTKAPQGGKARQQVLGILTFISTGVNTDLANEVNSVHRQEFPNANYPKFIKTNLPKTALEIGDQAPEIVMNNPDGKPLKLSSLKGKVVLIDFWASWCGPCRQESPNVVRAYNKYKDKGFTVFSVSLDGDANKWKEAIIKDQLSWPYHVSDLKKWGNEAAKEYMVRGIPAMYLIDENGIIIGKNLRGQELHNKLDQIFK